MSIKHIADLVDGEEYWHLFVENACHWQIKEKPSIYKKGVNWNDMIVFDNDVEAKNEAIKLQAGINSLIIK